MTSQSDLVIIRRAYARQVAHGSGSEDPRLEAALAEIPREDFLGPGPWIIPSALTPHSPTPDADPVFVYRDTPIALVPDKGLNNGHPSYVTGLIGLCAIRDGDRVVHIGTGTGYFTALMSRLAGDTGSLLGIEHEAELASRATALLAGFGNTRIVAGDGFTMPLEPADAIFVNAGTPRFAATWLDALKPGGRLVVPLAHSTKSGTTMTSGMIFLITRDAKGFAARCRIGTAIYHCAGAGDSTADAALEAAIAGRRMKDVTRLRRAPVAAERTWLSGDGWSLTYD